MRGLRNRHRSPLASGVDGGERVSARTFRRARVDPSAIESVRARPAISTASPRVAAAALDAEVLIAFREPSDAQRERAVSELRARMAAGEQLRVGASVYAEVMVRPLAGGTDAKVDFI
jgi:hypothetical protein